MRFPHSALVAAILILFAACSSTSSDQATETDEGGVAEAPTDLPKVTGQIVRVEWKNLNRRRQDPPLGLINRSSPELRLLYKNPAAYAHIKPVDDMTMGTIVEAFRQVGFFEHATPGLKLDSLDMGAGHGAVYCRIGDDHWTLLFGPGMGDSSVPEIYRDCKGIIIEFHRRTLWLQPTSPQDPDRVFRVPSGSGR